MADSPTSPDSSQPPISTRSRIGRSVRLWFLGPERQSRLTITHCVHSAAEAFFVISMAGSIFFNVSADAARPRVLLYLVLTLAPFLVMAPLVGPIVDRVRGGLATTMIATFVTRAVLAVLLAENLRTLLLFPLAFGVLIVAKTYSVSRNAMLPALVDDQQDLVSANARLSRSATIAGGLAAAAAVPLFAATSGAWTLRVGAVVYALGAYTAFRVRSVAKPIEPIEHEALIELVRPDVESAVWDMMALRAAIGFAMFQFGFSLRSDGEPAWVFGLVILASGVGGFTGTVIATRMRQRLTERSMFTAALVGSALATALCGLVFNRVTLVLAIFVLGLAVSIGRRALDATIQTHAPHARRGQVYAGLETRLELAWVLAAVLAVATRIASWIGVLTLAVFLAFVTIIHLRRRSGLNVLRSVAAVALPERLLLRAQTLADHGMYDEAIIIARAALGAAAATSDERHGPDSSATTSDLQRTHQARADADREIDHARRQIRDELLRAPTELGRIRPVGRRGPNEGTLSSCSRPYDQRHWSWRCWSGVCRATR